MANRSSPRTVRSTVRSSGRVERAGLCRKKRGSGLFRTGREPLRGCGVRAFRRTFCGNGPCRPDPHGEKCLRLHALSGTSFRAGDSRQLDSGYARYPYGPCANLVQASFRASPQWVQRKDRSGACRYEKNPLIRKESAEVRPYLSLTITARRTRSSGPADSMPWPSPLRVKVLSPEGGTLSRRCRHRGPCRKE